MTMHARMKNPAMVLPGALRAIHALKAAIDEGGAEQTTRNLVHLRVSQINGCGACVDAGSKHAKKQGETDERLFAVAAWRETPYFTEAERAALELAECVTRLNDRDDPVPDDVWQLAAKHFDEKACSALLLEIAITNLYNRLNAPTKQVAGRWG
jgi:AhpD family alkylhydroperoxidase